MPKELGGPGGATNPEQLFATGYAACFHSALKLVAYGSTAGFLGGVFSLIPSLGILGILTALYSIYLIYTGIPVLMKSPPEKAGAYTAVVIVCGFVAMIVLGAVTSLAMPGRGMSMVGLPGGSSSGDGAVSIKTPGGASAWRRPASAWSRRTPPATWRLPARR